ncbi:hypothetical protein NOG11_02575 [Parvularcula sp. BGMRC 0090]|uniref:Uncharacterized protein n=1 Tax=Parvularcula maris TaxID=2965077 RepID=A0A9X2RIW5_9PROT|nr:hypothetical protein [Parvularcula maris]
MAAHVAGQNWLAVGIDLVIVVVGVFLGIQLGNWNAARADEQRHEAALDQLAEEIAANRLIVQDYRATYEERVDTVQRSADLLRQCASGPEVLAEVEAGLQLLRGTPGFYPQTSAIRALTEDDSLKRQQGEVERQALQELRRIIERIDDGAAFLEDIPFRNPIEAHPIIAYASSLTDDSAETGLYRDIVLTVPLSEACRDADLLKALYSYERVGSFSLRLADMADDILDRTTTTLGLQD